MATKEIRTAALAVRTKTDLKNFLHEHIGLTLSESRDVANAVCSAAPADISAAGQPLTKAGVVRMARDFRAAEKERRDIACAEVWDEAWEKAHAYRGPMPEARWVEIDGKQCLLDSCSQVQRMFMLELAEKWLQELDSYTDNDELEAALLRRNWTEARIDDYIEKFGKGQTVTAGT